LGNLVGEYLDRIYQGAKINNGSAFLMQFSVEADKEFILERKLALENLVAQRNQLVHHKLIELDSKSISSCKKLCAELDKENEKLKFEFEILRGQALSLIESSKLLVKKNNYD
jgi:hypothetical protein